MSVDQPKVIDILGIDSQNRTILTISDHLDWADSLKHQLALQTKLNTYLLFVESGELSERYSPHKTGGAVVFKVVFLYAPDSDGIDFLKRASEVIANAGFSLEYKVGLG